MYNKLNNKKTAQRLVYDFLNSTEKDISVEKTPLIKWLVAVRYSVLNKK